MQVKAIEAALDGIVHADTQRGSHGFDLTASKIHRIEDAGRIDFGGGELAPPEIQAVHTTKRSEDDDYGWWNLDEGTYLLTYNEALTLDDLLLLQPRAELAEQGVTHPTLAVNELPQIPISVGEAGARIKENARVSTLVPV
jgi:hypothetical protein